MRRALAEFSGASNHNLVEGVVKGLVCAYDNAVLDSVELLCGWGLRSKEEYHTGCATLWGSGLAHLGWDKETSLQMYKNFRLCFPQLRYDPIMHKVMTRAQLIEEYGLFGHVMDDVAHRPGSQPYFDLLLTGNVDLAEPREVHMCMFAIEFEPDVAKFGFKLKRAEVFGHHDNGAPLINKPVSQGQILSYARASEIYRNAVGETPDFLTDIHPIRYDYEDLAKAGIDLREPHGKE